MVVGPIEYGTVTGWSRPRRRSLIRLAIVVAVGLTLLAAMGIPFSSVATGMDPVTGSTSETTT